ncbi:MAG: hypothetical protein HYW51_01540 [Candidatus Doudnabacteria bacterium]|nr:hypothetical protein [Candidatus Doudnabacteria bacterium]
MPKRKIKKNSSRRHTTRKPKHYPVYYLAALVIAFLLLEIALLGSARIKDWQESFGILDVSEQYEDLVDDLSFTFSPMAQAVSAVDEFYNAATDEATALFDATDSIYENMKVYENTKKFALSVFSNRSGSVAGAKE